MNTDRSWVEIDNKALEHNVSVFHNVTKGSRLMAVVKSNAYGHGMLEVAKILNNKISWFGVDDLDEALTLRKAGIKKPILVLGYTQPSRYVEAAKNRISITISSWDSLRHFLQIAHLKNLHIHLKLETGLNRQGMTEQELLEVIKLLKNASGLEGIYSHFAAAELADQKKYRDYCDKQMDKYERMARLIDPKHKSLWHMGATAATINLPRSRYDLVRVGIGLYGLDPTSDIKLPLVKKVGLKPAMSWYSTIAQVKNVKKGERIGYNLTEQAKEDMKIAIVPVGYWHGYPRALSRVGKVLAHGRKCKIMGRISMCMTIVDVTNIPGVKAGDVVTLIGKGLSAEEVATKAGTINYELVTRINPLLLRSIVSQ